MHSFIFIFLTILTLTPPALTGSRRWQPPLGSPSPEAKHQLDKRWMTINLPGTAAAARLDPRPWPNREITYCFADKTAKSKLKTALKKAMDLWYSGGLTNDYTIVEGSSHVCSSEDSRREVLMISYGDKLSTYVGYPDKNSRLVTDLGKGAYATWTDRKDIGMLSVVPNIAHELGHAWGLYHEHQNPYFWSSAYLADGGGGSVFGPGNNNWNCENLADYDKFADGKEISPGGGLPHQHYTRDQMCRSYRVASAANFSAAEYLPMAPYQAHTPMSIAADARMVDWDSIMIYPSGAGAKKGLDPPEETDGVKDDRLSILEKPPLDGEEGDMQRIPKNIIPSSGDIEAMNKLYGSVRVEKKGLLHERGSTKEKFKKAFLGSKDSSSCV
ncbi:uncharacterized protein BJX67DRAFT_365827 [Aspergillus lucknowensis]|uniref:Uncharacterized protein n=1 Tax=Aspergillus lucknowensis TaxID=176173 RepID=A0ABR4LDV1_9EURO